jgi:hypothetical protein
MLKPMIGRALFAFLATFLITCPAQAWWETGHRVVARSAVPLLTEAARTRLARILQVPNTPEAIADALADASIWADQTKSQTHTAAWHFIDLALQDKEHDIPERCKGDNCLTARIPFFANTLKNHPNDSEWSELDALRYLVHFIGDVHQPLHDATDADEGGNCETVNPPINEAKNIHAVWDGGIVRAMNKSEAEITADVTADIKAMHQRQREKVARGSADDWAWEGHELAVKLVYHKLHIPIEAADFPHACSDAPADIWSFKAPIDYLYIDSMKPVVQEQLTKASIRLARVLNESL